jgi:hypothetical protein
LVLSADLKSILVNEGWQPEDVEARTSPNELASRGMQFKVARIRPVTSRGVRLGMSEEQVTKVLGKPTKTIWSKKFQARELIYHVQTRLNKAGEGQAATNYYLFRGGKLYYLELARSAIGGA